MKTFVCLLVLGGICAAFGPLGGVVMAQGKAEGSIFGEDSPIRLDEFEDGEPGQFWRTYVEDANACRVIETNGRLELRASGKKHEAFAGYIGSTWRLDPREDFTVKVDFHYDLETLAKGRITIGLTPDGENPRQQRVDFGVGCVNLLPSYWYETKNGYSIRTSYVSRILTDGVLYLSYDATQDALYISDVGYGQENAWMTIGDLLQEQWGGQLVYLYLGGSANGLVIDSGHAYFDNLVVDAGAVNEPASTEIYRFWSPVTGRHFFTMDEGERDRLIEEYSDVWTYEGIAFHVPNSSDPNARPIHRFWSEAIDSYFYTIDEAERVKLIDEYADVWEYQGIVFYAYPIGLEPEWALPVYRFWSATSQSHFFTISEQERDKLLNHYAHYWTYEGIVWYANK